MSELVAFLRARLDEDETTAKAVMNAGVTDAIPTAFKPWDLLVPNDPYGAVTRLLREVEAKRRLIAETEYHWNGLGPLHLPIDVFRLLALPYSDHPDYDPEWAVTMSDSGTG